MGHLDEGLIQAFLDGEPNGPVADEVRDHLDACAECRNQLQVQGDLVERVQEALAILDREPDLDAARSRVRAWTENGRGEGTVWASVSLPRAASIALLIVGGAATALPGSPVRAWIMDGWRSLTGSPVTQVDEGNAPSGQPETVVESPVSVPEETGASILPGVEGVEIWVQELGAGGEVTVHWTDDDRVRIFSGEGTGYRTATGRLEAVSPTGSVRIEIPRTVRDLVVGANGQILIRKTGDSLQVLAPTLTRTRDEIRFAPLTPSDRTGS